MSQDADREVEVAAEEQPAVQVPKELDPMSALEAVLRNSLYRDGLARGLRECVKALDRRQAHLCVLSSSCTEALYVKLIVALCHENHIPMMKIDDSKKLGQWVGLCKYDKDGNAVNVVGCSCAVVKNWGEDSEQRQYLLNYIKNNS